MEVRTQAVPNLDEARGPSGERVPALLDASRGRGRGPAAGRRADIPRGRSVRARGRGGSAGGRRGRAPAQFERRPQAKFGTPTNERFQIECARNLGLSSGPVKASGQSNDAGLQKSVKRFDGNYMLVKRDPIAYANIEWARRIAPAFGARSTVWVLLAEGRVDTAACSKLPKNFVVRPLDSKNIDIGARDAVIVVAPGVTTSWQKGYDLAERAGAPVVFLNSQLSERYALGGPLDAVEEVYYLKPISKGFVFRACDAGRKIGDGVAAPPPRATWIFRRDESR